MESTSVDSPTETYLPLVPHGVFVGKVLSVVRRLEPVQPGFRELEPFVPPQLEELSEVDQFRVGTCRKSREKGDLASPFEAETVLDRLTRLDGYPVFLDFRHSLDVEHVAELGELDLDLGQVLHRVPSLAHERGV
jgi:hypothetical protein